MPTTDLRNPLVPFCHECLSHLPNWRKRLSNPDLSEATLHFWSRVATIPEATPAHSALRLAVDTRAGGKPDIRPEWKRQRGRPCRTGVQQIEDDTGLNAIDAWRIAHRPQVFEGATTRGRSSVPLTDWLTDCQLLLLSLLPVQ